VIYCQSTPSHRLSNHPTPQINTLHSAEPALRMQAHASSTGTLDAARKADVAEAVAEMSVRESVSSHVLQQSVGGGAAGAGSGVVAADGGPSAKLDRPNAEDMLRRCVG
jgi:hypothetical protein